LVGDLEHRGGLAPFEHEMDGVHTSWDLGLSDATAIWFWRPTEGGADVLDYLEANGKPLSYFFDELEKRPYRYAKHWLPHDARARTLAAGVSVLDQCMERLGRGSVAIGPNLSLLDGIQAARWLLQRQTRLHPRCSEGLEALRAYHYAFDDDSKSLSRKPVHDWSSHGADAWRYLSCVVRAAELLTRPPPEPPRVYEAPPQTVGEMFEQHYAYAHRRRQ
jgi:phage terminase large subunit